MTIEERMLELEQRLTLMEKKYGRMALRMEKEKDAALTLIERHGEYVTKKDAARILDVTRATVYTMLEDGRLTAGHGGHRVSTASIAAYMTSKKDGAKPGPQRRRTHDACNDEHSA